MKREFLEQLSSGGQPLEPETVDAILSQHSREMDDLRFSHLLERSIVGSGGRSAKAITALLDVAALQESEDPTTAVQQALEQLKSEHSYLFASPTPPPYARGTGSRMGETQAKPVTLAGALREKFERK